MGELTRTGKLGLALDISSYPSSEWELAGNQEDCLSDISADLGTSIVGTLESTRQPTFTCIYCHGETTNDYRGNCAACGAPREKEKQFHGVTIGVDENGNGIFRISADLGLELYV